MKIFRNLLAFVCFICPLCVIARIFPYSRFAEGMKEFGKSCPFCRAYARLKLK